MKKFVEFLDSQEWSHRMGSQTQDGFWIRIYAIYLSIFKKMGVDAFWKHLIQENMPPNGVLFMTATAINASEHG
jgi:hypothetical protein